MSMNAGIVTEKLAESKAFYRDVLGFAVAFENEFYLLMRSPGGEHLSFLLPDHPSQQSLFHKSFEGQGIYLTLEVDHVDDELERISRLGVPLAVGLRDEPWGDRHFAIVDPNGVAIDVVTYSGTPGTA